MTIGKGAGLDIPRDISLVVSTASGVSLVIIAATNDHAALAGAVIPSTSIFWLIAATKKSWDWSVVPAATEVYGCVVAAAAGVVVGPEGGGGDWADEG